MKKIKFITIILFIFSFIHICNTAHATVCDFNWYKIQNNNVYWETYCENKILDIIPFADNKTFKINEDNVNKWSDKNYLYIEKFVEWRVDNSEFIKLNNVFYTDEKNIFIKSQGLYLYISEYDFNTKIFTIYQSDNGWRYILKVNWKIYNINISWDYVSYNWGIHKITNIDNVDNLEQINQFIFSDWKYFYSSLLENKINQWLNFGFNVSTADFFSSNNNQLVAINEMWKWLLQNSYSQKNIEKLSMSYKQLKLKKNPYNMETQSQGYWEFIIKKELLLYYLWLIINK